MLSKPQPQFSVSPLTLYSTSLLIIFFEVLGRVIQELAFFFFFSYILFPWLCGNSAETLTTIKDAMSRCHLLLVISQALSLALCTIVLAQFYKGTQCSIQ
jgi:hypothetical protein